MGRMARGVGCARLKDLNVTLEITVRRQEIRYSHFSGEKLRFRFLVSGRAGIKPSSDSLFCLLYCKIDAY